MLKKDIPLQQKLFNEDKPEIKLTKKKNILSPSEKLKKKEKSDAHRSWKLYKARKFDTNLTQNDKYLLQKYYGIRL